MGILLTIIGKFATAAEGAGPSLIGKGVEKLFNAAFRRKKRKTVNYTPLKACIDIHDVIGRGKEVKCLWKTLKKKKAIMLTGFGGIGKTLLAQMLFSKYESKFDEVAWIDYQGDLKTSFINSIKAEALQIEGNEDKRWNHMVEVLINNRKKKLFVIDNVDHNADQQPKLDEELRSLAHWKNTTVLLTSRMDELQGYKSFNLSTLEMKNCVKLFKKHCNIKPKAPQTIINIIELAHKNTLTIELLAKGAMRCDLEDYYHRLVEKGFQALDRNVVVNHDEEEATIERHLRILFDMQSRSELDREILYSFAILPVNCRCNINEIEHWFGFKNADLDHVIQDGWLDYEENHEEKSYTCSLHPLVRTIVRFDFSEDTEQKKSIAPLGTADKIMECFCNHLEQFDISQGYTSLQRMIGIIESVIGSVAQEETRRMVKLYHIIGKSYREMGEYSKALAYVQKALEISEKVLGTKHHGTAISYNNIGKVYAKLGDYGKALKYYQMALEIREKVLGTKHPDTAITYNNIGHVYYNLDDYGEALKYHQKALEIREKVLGTEHTNTAISYNNIGMVYDAQGDHDKAVVYYQKALEILEKVLGTDHPNTAGSYGNIGLVYYEQGNYDKALEYHQKALEIREKVLGTEHPGTAISYNNIGDVYYAQGNYDKALEYNQKAYQIFEKVLGPKHHFTMKANKSLNRVKQALQSPSTPTAAP